MREYVTSKEDDEFSEAWMKRYGQYLTRVSRIRFDGSVFVFSGLDYNGFEYGNPIVQEVLEKGGTVRFMVTRSTDYLVVDPRFAGHEKVSAAISGGKKTKIILLSDLRAFLDLMDSRNNNLTVTFDSENRSDSSDSIGGEPGPNSDKALEDLGDLSQKFHELTIGFERIKAYYERNQEKERENCKEKVKAVREAIKKGKSEEDAAYMYIILSLEKISGDEFKSEEAFCDVFEDDFPAYTRDEIIQLRKDVLRDIANKKRCEYYDTLFMRQEIGKRVSATIVNLCNVFYRDMDVVTRVKLATKKSERWFAVDEYTQVHTYLNDYYEKVKKSFDETFEYFDMTWLNFSTAKDSLNISVQDGKKVNKSNSDFQVEIDNRLVRVVLKKDGFLQVTVDVGNDFPFYWGVSVEDIWKSAIDNCKRDTVDEETKKLADEVYKHLCKRH